MIRDIFTCTQKLTASEHSLPHKTKKKPGIQRVQALADISCVPLCCQQWNSRIDSKSAQQCTTRGHPIHFLSSLI